jgi:orotate phosphoribosyltransferase
MATIWQFCSMTNEKIIAEKLLQINAIKLSIDEPFTWASGLKSPIYCDNRKVLSHPFQRDFIKSEMSNIVFEAYPNADVICGVATAGIPWGAMVADQIKLPFIYCRPEPKKHGLGNQIEGGFKPGQRVVVIEDLVSTGKSSLQVVDVLRNEGLIIEGMVAIFSYGFPMAAQHFADKKVALKTLTNYSSLLQIALEKGFINAEIHEILGKWNVAPELWGNGI